MTRALNRAGRGDECSARAEQHALNLARKSATHDVETGNYEDISGCHDPEGVIADYRD